MSEEKKQATSGEVDKELDAIEDKTDDEQGQAYQIMSAKKPSPKKDAE